MWDDGNNTDELFRKAAKDYPLKKPADSWDEIAALLKNATPGKVFEKKNNVINRYNALLILLTMLLIFSALATNDGWHLSSSVQYSVKKNEILAGSEKKINIPALGNVAIDQKKAAQKILRANFAIKIPDNNKLLDDPGYSRLKSKSNSNQLLITNSEPENQTKIARTAMDEKSILQEQSKGNLPATNSLTNLYDSVAAFTPIALSADVEPLAQLIDKKNMPGDKQSILSRQERVIYFGFLAGPSFNQVKSQGLNKGGFDIGLLAGYRLNSKLSIESGLLFEKKYYFSDGKYFDMSKAGSGMPAGMQVLSLEGSCAIFEIPLKLKYDFANNNHTSFFAATGISTYIITKEYNKYKALISGTQQNVTGIYNNTSNYFAATIHISGGYQRKIGKMVTLRIEPYLQIPIRGLGIGSLPILSTGIHLGITIPVLR